MSGLDVLIGELVEQLAPLLAAELAVASPVPAVEEWRLLDLSEAVDRLGRSQRQVRKWVASGELVCVRLDGGDLRFDLDDLKAFAKARRVGVGVLAERWQPSRQGASVNGSRGRHEASNRRVGT